MLHLLFGGELGLVFCEFAMCLPACLEFPELYQFIFGEGFVVRSVRRGYVMLADE